MIKSKKVLIITGVIVAIVIVVLLYFFVFAKQSKAIGNIQIYDGTAKVVHENKTTDAETGTEIALSDSVNVAQNSRAAIVLKDGTIIRLKGGTNIQVAELTYEGEKLKDVHLKLTSGQAWSRVKPLSKDSQFEVETPAVTAAVRGTSFNTTLENNKIGVFVSNHSVDVTLKGTSEEHLITDKKILWMKNNNLKKDFAKGPVSPDPDFFENEWIKFNLQEDAKLCKKLHDIPDCEDTVTTPSPTSTPTETPEPTKKLIPTRINTPTPTKAPTNTPSPTHTPTKTPTSTYTPTPTKTPTSTPTPTNIPVQIFRAKATPTPTKPDIIIN